MKKLTFLFILVLLPLMASAQGQSQDNQEGDTLTLSEEGTLSLLLSEMATEKRIKYLTLRGPINWADLRVLIIAEGRLENMESLDLRDVTLIPGGDYYVSSSYFGDGTLFTTNELYYLSDERHEERRSDGLSSGSTQYHCYYDYNLAGAFIGTKLKRIVMPKSINEVGRYAFFRSTNLKTVEYDQPLVYVGDRAFYECNNLQHIPDLSHVTSMDEYAFTGCESLSGTLNLSSLDSIPMKAFTQTMAVDSVVFSDNLYYIGQNAFTGCGLKSAIIDSPVEIIEGAFAGCERLKNVSLSEKITSLGASAFSRCTALSNVDVSPLLTRLPSDLFYDTPWFKKLPFDNHVKYIGNVAMITDGSTSVAFREGTISIADYFNWYFDIPGIVGDYNYRIYKSTQLPTSITLPSSLRIIGNQAFIDHQLSSLTLPDDIEEIGYDAFKNCQIVTLNLPSSLKKIGASAFASNTKLIRIIYDVPNAEGYYYGDRYHPRGIFNNCSQLERVDFGPNVLTIPVDAFLKCKQLVTVNMQEGLQTIGYQAFSTCTALSKIKLPSTVTYMDRDAFYDCTNLLTVRSNIKQPTELERPFYYTTYNNGTLYVPAGTKEVYKQVWGWKEFGTIVEMEDVLRGDVNGDGIVNGTDIQAIINLIVEGMYDEKADVNRDSVVNGTDIQEVINIIVN